MKVAIIILNFNSSAYCRTCVSFLLKQEGVESEIIVVDNCSGKDDVEAVQSLCEELGLTFLKATGNRGYSAGNNIGLRYAASKGFKYALIANPDMEFYQSNYINELIKVMERDEHVVVCASDIINMEGSHQNPVHLNTYWDDFWGILRSYKRDKDKESRWRESRYCDSVHGCCMMLNVDFLKSINFLDEHTFLYCEERILSAKVRQSKKRLYYYADVQAVHHHINSEKGNSRRNMNILIDSRDYFYRSYSQRNSFARFVLKVSETIQFNMIYFLAKIKRRCC